MGYLYLTAVLLLYQIKGYCGKKQSEFVHSVRDALLLNFLRMLCCFAVATPVVWIGDGFGSLAIGAEGMWIALLSGFSNAGMLILWIIIVRRSAYILLDVFGTLGVIVPLVVCRFLFDERIRLIQWAGFALLCAAVTLMCSYSSHMKRRTMHLTDILLLIVFSCFSGLADLSQKLYVNYCPDGTTGVFNFYTFLFAALLIGLLLLLFRKKEDTPPPPLRRVGGYITVMSVTLFMINYCKTATAAILPAMQMYPLLQGGMLVCASLMGALVFGEKITKRCVLGMTLTFIALLMINLL